MRDCFRPFEAGNDRPIVVVGAGGHAKVVIDLLRFAGWTVAGCTDSRAEESCNGAPILGNDELLPKLRAEGIAHAICAIGANPLRERISEGMCRLGFSLPWVAGPGAIVAPSVKVGRGTVIMAGAVVNVATSVGDFVILNTNSNVDHDGLIGRAAHIGPGAALAGEVTVGDRTFVGTGSAVIPQVTIGADCLVGAGSVVVRDIPDKAVAFGNPASVRRGNI